jgi:hypothetical protein
MAAQRSNFARGDSIESDPGYHGSREYGSFSSTGSIQDKPKTSCVGAACKKLSKIGKNIKKKFTRKNRKNSYDSLLTGSFGSDQPIMYDDVGRTSFVGLGGRRKRRRRRTRKKKGGKRRRTRKKKRKRHKKKKTRKKKGGMPILSTFSRGAIAALALFQDPAGNYIHPKGDKTVPHYSLNSTHTGIKGNMKALSPQQLSMAKKYNNELVKYDKDQMSYSQAQWFHTMSGDQAAAINVAAEASRQPKPEKPKFAVEVGDVDPQIAKKYGWRT